MDGGRRGFETTKRSELKGLNWREGGTGDKTGDLDRSGHVQS